MTLLLIVYPEPTPILIPLWVCAAVNVLLAVWKSLLPVIVQAELPVAPTLIPTLTKVALTAWKQWAACTGFDAKAATAFRKAFRYHAPENFPKSLLGPGQSLFVHGFVVGFERDGGTKQPKLALELRILDEAGKPTLAAPMTGTIEKDVVASAVS